LIFSAAARAVERLKEGDVPDPFVMDTPVKITVEFFSSEMADRARLIPGTRRAGTRLTLAAEEMVAAYWGFRAMVTLASG
jgi:D-aminopeptidase